MHQEHEYFAAHPDWFTHRLRLRHDQLRLDGAPPRLPVHDYLPDVNWTNPDGRREQYAPTRSGGSTPSISTASASTRSSTSRHRASINLVAAVRDEFEAAGTRVFMIGETAMGWNDCGLAVQPPTVPARSAQYIGPDGLDGQFDFVLYHAVPYRTSSPTSNKGMIHADYWAQQSAAASTRRARS